MTNSSSDKDKTKVKGVDPDVDQSTKDLSNDDAVSDRSLPDNSASDQIVTEDVEPTEVEAIEVDDTSSKDLKTTVPEASSADAHASDHVAPQKSVQGSKFSFSILAKIISLILFVVACVYGGLFAKNYLFGLEEKLDEQNEEQKKSAGESLERLQGQIAGLIKQNKNAQNKISNLEKKLNSTHQQADGRLRAAEERLQAQNRRLLSISTTTREDWLLAEAEYLLKLANQRVVIEKNAENAVSLLEEADGILRDLRDPDLYAIRQVLQRDLASLRLVEKVDREGMYLSLLSLAEQVNALPVLPEYKSDRADDKEMAVDLNFNDSITNQQGSDFGEKEQLKADGKDINQTLIDKISSSFSSFTASLKNAFNVVDYEDSSMNLVSPQISTYVRQNLRMIIERSQLALLREQHNIYASSLDQGVKWLQSYFPRSSQRQAFIDQLNALSHENIVAQVPDITQSLQLLNSYIEEIHQLQDGLDKPQVDLKEENGE